MVDGAVANALLNDFHAVAALVPAAESSPAWQPEAAPEPQSHTKYSALGVCCSHCQLEAMPPA